ncbi:MAG: hypothetical protein ACI4OA_02440 [Selenomonadaceae bacterium]
MCDIMEKIKNEYREAGIALGIKAGMEEARGNVAMAMLKDCAPIGKIEQYTGWTNEKIRDFAIRNNLTVH